MGDEGGAEWIGRRMAAEGEPVGVRGWRHKVPLFLHQDGGTGWTSLFSRHRVGSLSTRHREGLILHSQGGPHSPLQSGWASLSTHRVGLTLHSPLTGWASLSTPRECGWASLSTHRVGFTHRSSPLLALWSLTLCHLPTLSLTLVADALHPSGY